MIFYKVTLWRISLLLIVSLTDRNFVYLIPSKSQLCETMDLSCGKRNNEECRMKYYKLNSTECRDMVFSDGPNSNGSELGKIQLESYHYNILTYKQTGFNVSLRDIGWKDFKFRFKQEGNEMKNTCREFHMLANSSVQNLFYDCLWSNETYEGKSFSFEYEMSANDTTFYKKYLFRVPFAKNIDEITDLSKWEVFVYTETVRNAFGRTSFIVHWQPLPSKFSVNTYNISIHSNEVVFFVNVTCSTFENCQYVYNKWYGSVQFGVQPICPSENGCATSKTVIFNLGGENAQKLLIGIVSVTVIIPAFVYILFLMRNHVARKTKNWIYPVPKLLFISVPSLSSHVNVVLSLVDYFKTYCNVEPLVDELHIYQSKSRDPFKWCNETFKTADCIVVLTSPYHKHLKLGDSVYQNTDVLLLRLLQERLASKDRKTKFCTLILPYCSQNDIPIEAVNLRRYSFPKDLNKMLKFIHDDESLPDCFNSKVQGGKRTYNLLGTKLKDAIEKAANDIRTNGPEYERLASAESRAREKGSGCEVSPFLAQVAANGKKPEVGEFRLKERSRVAELAEDMFSEFPGRLDDLNLSGEEGESLVESYRRSTEANAVDLDTLDL